jgi:hypothetical protein
MIGEEKIKEIKKMVRSGIPEGEVKENLIKEGYSKEDIDKAFTPHRYDMRSWYITFVVLFFFVGIWVYFKTESWLVLIISALLFVQYFRETNRIKKETERM